ncbi:MAG: DUF4430 domain-containing protein [Clostridiales Family XIII bacterium]|jgi:hypothetical protein|nr:DUF4430 domain-containing protein [Clostridiales Family XIII bacterium]
MLKRIFSVLLVIVMCLSSVPPISLAAPATITFQYSGEFSDSAEVQFAETYYTSSKTGVSITLDYDSGRGNAAVLSSLANGYQLNGWRVKFGNADVLEYSENTAIEASDWTYAYYYWLGFTNNASIPNNSGLGGAYFYGLTESVIIEPIIVMTDIPEFSINTSSDNITYGLADKEKTGINRWQLTATPALNYALDHWEYKSESTAEHEDAVDGWLIAEDSYGKSTYTVELSEEREYKAVFAAACIMLDDSTEFSLPIVMQSPVEPIFYSHDNAKKYLIAYNKRYGQSTPIVGEICTLTVPWRSSGALGEIGSNLAYEGVDSKHIVRLKLYAGDNAEGEPLVDSGSLGLTASNTGSLTEVSGGNVTFFFLLPATETLTVSMQLDEQAPVVKTYRTGQNLALTNALSALDAKYNDINNPPMVGETQYTSVDVLKYRYLIDTAIKEAGYAYTEGMDGAAITALCSSAEEKIVKYFTGEDKSYITVSFGGKDGGADGGNIVRVRDKDSQQDAMMAAWEQLFPREKAYWYLDCSASAFGLWVNGMGGRFFTDEELSSGMLSSAIVTPSKTFAQGEPLPKSGRVMGSQKGGAQYWVNGFYANFGITGWLCSNGDRFTWGPGGSDDGIPDWDEPGGEVWTSPLKIVETPETAEAFAYIMSLSETSTDEDIQQGREKYKAMLNASLAEFWNPQYGTWLATHFDSPVKTANDHLTALEVDRSSGGDPLPTVVYTAALSGALDHIRANTPGFGSVGGDWAALALARGGRITNNYKTAYLAALDSALSSNAAGTESKTDKARIILALSALGIDAAAYKDLDLIGSMDELSYGTINGEIYALLALDSRKYESENRGAIIIDATDETESISDGYIKKILGAQLPDGGWTLDEGELAVSGVDLTAMAVQAIAPYYMSSTAVHSAVDKALEYLKGMKQPASGGFAGFGGSPANSTESDAQVVVALSSLGIDPASWNDAAGHNPLTAMLSNYNEEGGWFGQGGSDAKNTMSTEQAAYALAAYDRLMNNESALYNMTDADGSVYDEPDTPGQDDLDIGAAKTLLEAVSFVSSQANAGSAAAAKAEVESIIGKMALGGVSAVIEGGVFTAATAGNAENPSGLAGRFTFTVKLSKGSATEQIFEGILTINAAAYITPGDMITVAATVEKFLVGPDHGGGGYFIEPTLIKIPKNSNAAYALTQLLADTGAEYIGTGTVDSAFYLSGIKDEAYTEPDTSTKKDGYLGERDEGGGSGWMFSVNNVRPGIGSSDFVLSDGDVMRWQYTLDTTGSSLIGANKDALTAKVAQIRAAGQETAYGAAYTNAISVLTNIGSTAQEIADAFTALNAGVVDKTSLNSKIAEASEKKDNAVVGDAPGQYPKPAFDAFLSAIAAAQAVFDDPDATQIRVDSAVTALDNAMTLFDEAIIPTPPEATYIEAHDKSLSWILLHTINPSVASIGGEWAVIARARSGKADDAWNALYLENLRTAIADAYSKTDNKVIIENGKPTENERVILALTALGYDAANFEGYDLVSPLADTAWVLRQGVNSNIYALIALNSKPYSAIDAKPLMAALLSAQHSDGSWGLDAAGDADVTAMAVQALAPYYSIGAAGNAAVKAAVDGALAWLYSRTIPDAEGNSQIIVALSALGIDASSYVDKLMTFYDAESGGFKREGAVNSMTTEQASYALTAYARYKNNQKPLYDMSDAGIAPEQPDKGDSDAVNEAAAALTWNVIKGVNASADAVTSSLSFPVLGENGVSMSWRSSDTGVITNAGTVTRPGAGSSDKVVTLTATVTKGAASRDVTFTVTVRSKSAPSETKSYAKISVDDRGAGKANLSLKEFELADEETAYSLLLRTGLDVRIATYSQYAGVYVVSINGFGEFDDGPLSGWMYKVNNIFPQYSSSLYELHNGDKLEWVYTRDLGADVGGGNFSGSGADSGNNVNPNLDPNKANDPVGGSAPANTISTEVKAALNDGAATAEIKFEAVKELIAKAKTGGKTNIAVAVTETQGAGSVKLSLTVASVNEVAKNQLMFTVQTEKASLTFSQTALAKLAADKKDSETVEIVVEEEKESGGLTAAQQAKAGSSPVIDLSVWAGGIEVSSLGGQIAVRLPGIPSGTKPEDYDLLTAYLLEGGGVQEMKGARYDAASGAVTFTTDHLSKFFVSEWINPFSDIAKDSWYYRAARFAYSNDLITGTTETTFAPQSTLTRAMLVTILARNAGVDISGGDEWYSKAVDWGMSAGLTDGTDMTANITREQFATLLYRYTGLHGNAAVKTTATGADTGGTVATGATAGTSAAKAAPGNTAAYASYSDADSVSPWADDAMAWASSNGLINGRTITTLAPKGEANRAEAATILQRFIEKFSAA